MPCIALAFNYVVRQRETAMVNHPIPKLIPLDPLDHYVTPDVAEIYALRGAHPPGLEATLRIVLM
jgi:hypothetical protein